MVPEPYLDTYSSLPEPAGKFVIFDRDKTLIEDDGYTWKVGDLRWRPGVLDLLSFLTSLRIAIFVATNQSGIGRGYFSRTDLYNFHSALVSQAADNGALIVAICSCPHIPGVCLCRKPEAGMLERIVREYCLNRQWGLAVGNTDSDRLAASAGGLRYVDGSKAVSTWSKSLVSWASS